MNGAWFFSRFSRFFKSKPTLLRSALASAPRVRLLALLGSLLCFLAGCAASPGADKELSIMSYNVRNLFDAKDDGGEYPEFSVANGRWNTSLYKRRQELLAKVILAAAPEKKGPDIVCLIEIENQEILACLAAGPLRDSGYRYFLAAPPGGSPVRCGLLSRLPLKDARAHILSQASLAAPGYEAAASPPRGRAVLEVELRIGTESLRLFICHWKSRLGGSADTEEERRQAAGLVRERLRRLLAADPGAKLIVCGDFNENPDEYLRVEGRYPTALMPFSLARPPEPGTPGQPRLLIAFSPAQAGWSGEEPVLYSPWEDSSDYSYSYKGERERLDGFLVSAGLVSGQGLSWRGFAVMAEDFLLDAEGEPLAWSSSRAIGYSDHLPILLRLGSFTLP